jgi:hypothetical protein
MADYNPSRKSRTESNKLSDYYGAYPAGPRVVGPTGESKPISHRPALEFSDEVRIVYDELMSLLLSKHKDYGAKNIADAPGGALNGLRVRMHDKLARINNLVDRDINPEHESLEDSFKDMANYAIIGLLHLRGKWDK